MERKTARISKEPEVRKQEILDTAMSRHAYKVMCLAGLQNLAVLKKKKEAEKSETA